MLQQNSSFVFRYQLPTTPLRCLSNSWETAQAFYVPINPSPETSPV